MPRNTIIKDTLVSHCFIPKLYNSIPLSYLLLIINTFLHLLYLVFLNTYQFHIPASIFSDNPSSLKNAEALLLFPLLP